MAGDQLGKVLVGRDHHHLVEPLLLGPVGCGAYDIVRLEAFAGEDGYVEGGNDFAYIGQARLNGFGHGFTVGLILGVHLMAEGRFAQVEGDRHVGGAELLDEVVHGHRKSQHGTRVHTLRVHTVGAAEGIKSPICDGHAVEKHQTSGFGCRSGRLRQYCAHLSKG